MVMTTIKCPLDTCLYNMEGECQNLEVELSIVEVLEVELLDCESYVRRNNEDM